MKKKVLLLVLSLAVVLTATIGGAVAYLRSETTGNLTIGSANTGDVHVTLSQSTGTGTVKVFPSRSVEMDPTVTVSGNVACYCFVQVTDNTGGRLTWEPAQGWTPLEPGSSVYWRAVAADASVNQFAFLKDNKVTFNADIAVSDQDQMNLTSALQFKAYAIQQETLESASAAWAALQTPAPTPSPTAAP